MSKRYQRGKADRTGRSDGSEHWTKITRELLNCAAWRALPVSAQALYPHLKLEWKGPDFSNNGQIQLSVRQAAERLNVTRNTAAVALRALQAKGFVFVTEAAVLGVEGAARAPSYELTELPLPGKTVGRRLYKDWKPGADLPVQKSNVNNPEGRNGKTKSRHEIRDEPVTKSVTNGRKTS